MFNKCCGPLFRKAEPDWHARQTPNSSTFRRSDTETISRQQLGLPPLMKNKRSITYLKRSSKVSFSSTTNSSNNSVDDLQKPTLFKRNSDVSLATAELVSGAPTITHKVRQQPSVSTISQAVSSFPGNIQVPNNSARKILPNSNSAEFSHVSTDDVYCATPLTPSTRHIGTVTDKKLKNEIPHPTTALIVMTFITLVVLTIIVVEAILLLQSLHRTP